MPLVLLEAVKPLEQESLGQRVDALSREVEDPHRGDHEVGTRVAGRQPDCAIHIVGRRNRRAPMLARRRKNSPG